MVLRISVILFLLAYLKPSKQQEPPFQFKLITPSPDVDINLILVECFEVERGQGNPDAFIWLNGISLATLTRVDRLPQTRRFRFIITRDLEGNYTCGTQEDSVNRLQSKPERLVAFPVLLPDIENTVHRGVSGNEARLPCAIRPGRLVGFYIATWRNATSGEVLVDFRMGMPRTNANFERYSVDPNDLSLVISEVTPADTGEYVCVLGVNGADRADGDMFYEQTRSINITLMVFDPPMISEPPVPQVVSLQENTFNSRNDGTTIFRCTATASTSVNIVWFHDGRDASRLAADDTSRYNTAILDSETDGGITRVTSQLAIESVGVNDNGVVVCEAQVPTSEALEDPVTATAETTLTVLGGFRKVTPRVTQDSHVLYDIELFDTIPTEVKLLIEYTPTGGQPKAIPTSEGFVNTTSILFLEREPRSDTEFTVRVALYIQGSGINGPFSDPSQTLDVRNRPLTRDELIATSVTATAGGFLIIVLIFVTVIVIVLFVRKHRTRESNLDRTMTTLNQIPMKRMSLLKRGPRHYPD